MNALSNKTIENIFCPRCKSPPGTSCKTPEGRETLVHADRIQQLYLQKPDIAKSCSVKIREFFPKNYL